MMPGERPVRWSRGLRRLLSGQDGQIMPLAGLLLLVMAALVFTVYNTGASVNRRVQTQQAADGSAHSAAVWHARGLNLIAGNNRAAARVASAIIALRAVDRTLDLAAIEIAAEKARTAANLTAAVGSMDPAAIARAKAEYDQAVREELILNTMRVPMSKPAIASMVTDKSGTLWATMRSLEYFSGAIAEYAVYAGQVRAMQLGRFNTEGEGICLVAAPTWAAFPTDLLPQGLSDPGATGRLPVVKTTFADFQEPVLNGRPSWPTVGRMDGGIGSYRAMEQAAGAYFTIALPKGTKNGQTWRQVSSEEQDKVFVDPGPQPWMPAPYDLLPSIMWPQPAAGSGADLRELGIWAVAGRRNLAPFWTHRFINQMPADLSTAFARAKVYNPQSWDLWSQSWQAKLIHADWTYDRLVDPNAVGPEHLAANLAVMIDTGAFDRLFADAIRVPGRVFPGGPIDPREATAARGWLERLSRGDLQWDATMGRSLIGH
jgi:hypothetical protein